MRSFDTVARIYRWGEAITFGPLLMRTRLSFLAQLATARTVLVLGDGDGRFTTRALTQYPQLHITAMDQSAAMLALLQQRAVHAGASQRLTAYHADVRALQPNTARYDAVCTHFLLDCLTTTEVQTLAQTMRTLAPRWIVSEFDVPRNALRQPAQLLVRMLYFTFYLLTGLRVSQLPVWRDALQIAGYCRTQQQTHLGGILIAEMWEFCAAVT